MRTLQFTSINGSSCQSRRGVQPVDYDDLSVRRALAVYLSARPGETLEDITVALRLLMNRIWRIAERHQALYNLTGKVNRSFSQLRDDFDHRAAAVVIHLICFICTLLSLASFETNPKYTLLSNHKRSLIHLIVSRFTYTRSCH